MLAWLKSHALVPPGIYTNADRTHICFRRPARVPFPPRRVSHDPPPTRPAARDALELRVGPEARRLGSTPRASDGSGAPTTILTRLQLGHLVRHLAKASYGAFKSLRSPAPQRPPPLPPPRKSSHPAFSLTCTASRPSRRVLALGLSITPNTTPPSPYIAKMASAAGGSRFQAFMNHPAGPKTGELPGGMQIKARLDPPGRRQGCPKEVPLLQ